MKVNLAKSAGFCFGVKRALRIAFATVKKNKTVEMLGDLVHNADVVRQIHAAGIKKIRVLRRGKDKTLLIRAHGASLKTFKHAEKLGYAVVDATCPMVKEIHAIAQGLERDGRRVIIIGDKKHDEVAGIVGQLKRKAIIVDTKGAIPLNRIKAIKKAGIVVQSTQNIETVMKIVRVLERYIKDLKFCNTICRPTQVKQSEIRKIPLCNDLVIVIGSRHSANTKRLYEIARSLNRCTYWIESKKDINPAWLKGARRVGITAGASTSDVVTADIANYIKER
jgi:4-hydroxy-3-methylbut-2-en-1-yl diphosphate reductase